MLAFKKTEANLIISGKTFYAKEAIKALGGTWDGIGHVWMLPAHLDSEYLRVDIVVKATAKEKAEKKKQREEAAARRAYAASPEGKAEAEEAERQRILACLEEKKKTGAYHWICCEKCEVIDWGRQHTSCMACASWSGQSWNTFRVRGSIYTGD
jgi:hypothetical protein